MKIKIYNLKKKIKKNKIKLLNNLVKLFNKMTPEQYQKWYYDNYGKWGLHKGYSHLSKEEKKKIQKKFIADYYKAQRQIGGEKSGVSRGKNKREEEYTKLKKQEEEGTLPGKRDANHYLWQKYSKEDYKIADRLLSIYDKKNNENKEEENKEEENKIEDDYEVYDSQPFDTWDEKKIAKELKEYGFIDDLNLKTNQDKKLYEVGKKLLNNAKIAETNVLNLQRYNNLKKKYEAIPEKTLEEYGLNKNFGDFYRGSFFKGAPSLDEKDIHTAYDLAKKNISAIKKKYEAQNMFAIWKYYDSLGLIDREDMERDNSLKNISIKDFRQYIEPYTTQSTPNRKKRLMSFLEKKRGDIKARRIPICTNRNINGADILWHLSHNKNNNFSVKENILNRKGQISWQRNAVNCYNCSKSMFTKPLSKEAEPITIEQLQREILEKSKTRDRRFMLRMEAKQYLGLYVDGASSYPYQTEFLSAENINTERFHYKIYKSTEKDTGGKNFTQYTIVWKKKHPLEETPPKSLFED